MQYRKMTGTEKGRDIKVEKEKISGIKQQCFSSIDSRADAIFELGRALFAHPELGFKEFETKKLLLEFLKKEGFQIYILSTESCDICPKCAYKEGKPCRYPDRMHPCLESHGVVVSDIVEEQGMEYNLGGNTILWFSLILIR